MLSHLKQVHGESDTDSSGLALGDRVADTEPSRYGDDDPRARVVDLPSRRADEYRIEAIGKTVAEENPHYPAGDRVVGIAFEKTLRRKLDPDAIDVIFGGVAKPETVSFYCDQFGIAVYHYPESRLRAIDESDEAGESR